MGRSHAFPILVAAALVSLPACKRDRNRDADTTAPNGDAGDGKLGPSNDPWAGQGNAAGPGLPPPQDVCEHVLRLFETEVGEAIEPVERAEMSRDCVAGLVEDHAHYGDGFYEIMSGCVLASTNMVELDRCADDESGDSAGDPGDGPPPSLPAGVDIPAELAPELLCRHLVELMREADPGMAEMLAGEEGESFIQACTADVIDQIRVRGPEGYLEEARCAMSIDRFDRLEECQPAP